MASYGMLYDFPVRLSITVRDCVFALGFESRLMVVASCQCRGQRRDGGSRTSPACNFTVIVVLDAIT